MLFLAAGHAQGRHYAFRPGGGCGGVVLVLCWQKGVSGALAVLRARRTTLPLSHPLPSRSLLGYAQYTGLIFFKF